MRKINWILAGLVGVTGMAHADDYPSRPIHIVVPYAPGGITDVATRMVAQKLEEAIGQTVIIENRAGAATTVASNYMARQKPDGYTLYAASVSLPLNQYLQPKVQYNAYEDFTVLSGLTDSPFVLQASTAMGVSSMDELLEKMKEKPGAYTIGASGAGAMNHIAAESWLQAGELDALIVQYQGGSQVRVGILSGELDLTFATLNEAQPVLADGKAKAIAITTAERVDALPDVPTIQEAMGLENFDMIFWTALLAPNGLSEERAEKIRNAMQKVGQDEDLRARLAKQGVILNVTDAQATRQRIRDADETFAPIIKAFQSAQ